MTAKIITEAAAKLKWCPFTAGARGPSRFQPPAAHQVNYQLSDRCLGDDCCVWQDAGNETGYCGLVAS